MVCLGQTNITDTCSVHELSEVIVQGERPAIKGQDGIVVVDLPSIIKDKPVTNVLEALGYLPGVIDNNGYIGLNGASSATLIINGEPTTMPLQNIYQLLYSTPVDRLKNVEIMYSAPAKYHVNGAVINVNLKNPQPLDGLMGQATLGYNQSHYASYCGGVSATYAINDWTFDLNWSINHNHSYNRQETNSTHLLNGTIHIIDDDMRQTSKSLSNIIHTAISYKKLKLSYNGQISSDIHNRSQSTGTLGYFQNLYKGLSPTSYNNLAMLYSTPFGLSAGCDFTSYYENRYQNLYKEDNLKVYSENLQNINRWHAYLDQEHKVGKWTLGYGIDYQHAKDKSCQSYKYPMQPGFDNTLHEDVASLYIGTQASFRWGLSFNSSVKLEYFHNDYQHNWNVIPQLGATFYKTPKSIFQLNISSQRLYPTYWELHGGTSFINDYAIIIGNPSLQPSINYSGQFNYIFNQKYAATFYMLYTNDYCVQLPYQSPTDLNLIFQTVNLDFSRTIGLQLYAPFDVNEIWNATATLNVSHAQQKSTHFHDLSFNNKRWGIYAALNNTIQLTPSFPISLSVDASYMAGMVQGAGQMNPIWKIDAGLKWRFGKNRCCEFDLKANDIFNTCNPMLKIDFQSQNYRMKAHNMNHYVKLTFSYRFNGFKQKQDTNIDISRFGSGK